MKKQILLIVMTLCAVSAMAVSLPKASYSSYRGYVPTQDTYSLSVGTTFVNQSTVGAYEDLCGPNSGFSVTDTDPCPKCCQDNVFVPCLQTEGEAKAEECYNKQLQCVQNCQYALGEERNPLDAPVFFLLALIAAYGAVAVYRRKKATV
jgi:hypothetical protein